MRGGFKMREGGDGVGKFIVVGYENGYPVIATTCSPVSKAVAKAGSWLSAGYIDEVRIKRGLPPHSPIPEGKNA